MKRIDDDNCLFCPTDSYIYGQIQERDVESTLRSLREGYPDVKWRVDRHRYSFVALPRLLRCGGCEYNNPNALWDGYVWITCAPEGSTCRVNKNRDVVVNTGVYGLYNHYVEGIRF